MLNAELVENRVEYKAGTRFGVWIDVNGQLDPPTGLGGGVHMDSGVGRSGLREGDQLASLWGSSGLIDHMSLAEKLGFSGDEDRFGADSRWEFGFKGAPEVGSGDGGLALPSGGFAHRWDRFAGLEERGYTNAEQKGDCSERGAIGCWHRDSVHDERIGDIGMRAAIAGMNGGVGLTDGIWVPLIEALRRLCRGL